MVLEGITEGFENEVDEDNYDDEDDDDDDDDDDEENLKSFPPPIQDPLAPLPFPESHNNSSNNNRNNNNNRSVASRVAIPIPPSPSSATGATGTKLQPGAVQTGPGAANAKNGKATNDPLADNARAGAGTTHRAGTAASGARKPQHREKNPHFKQLEKTGSWGDISKKELIVVGTVVLLVVCGSIGAVLYFLVFKNSAVSKSDAGALNNDGPMIATRKPTMAPSVQPDIDPAVQFEYLYKVINDNFFTGSSLPSQDLAYYTTDPDQLMNNDTQLASVRAMAWILTTDPQDVSPENNMLLTRYALASLFYDFGGPTSWTNATNWLSGASACDWYGISCDRFREKVQDFDLYDNQLVGTIPKTFYLLSDLRSIVLTDNQLTGTIPTFALGSLPYLGSLYVNANQLTGDMAGFAFLRAESQSLTTLVVQENNFTGAWPREFCPRTGDPPILSAYSLDCKDDTYCLCCTEDRNCF